MSYQLYYWWLHLRSRLFDDERGQNITEYALVLGLVVVAAIGLLVAFRTQLKSFWNNMLTELFGIQPSTNP